MFGVKKKWRGARGEGRATREEPGGVRGSVFGGQAAGQALVAAGRTVPADRPVHSLHAYFIRPGDPAVPLIYLVDRVRDGRSFTTRRVSAVQHGKTIFTLSASLHHPEEGVLHQRPMPAAPQPEELTTAVERMEQLMVDANGVGLAATQIGVLQRLFVFQRAEDEVVRLIGIGHARPSGPRG